MENSISNHVIKKNLISLWNTMDTLQNEYNVSKTEISNMVDSKINTSNTDITDKLTTVEGNVTTLSSNIYDINAKNTEQDERLNSLDETKLSITSKENKNATFNVVRTDKETYLTVHHFQITVTFEDTEYEPKFTTEEKNLLKFNINYRYEDKPNTPYVKRLRIYTQMIDGELKTRSSNCIIDSFEVLKGSIIINVHVNKRSSRISSIYSYEYYPNALIAPVFIDDHITTKNLTWDNETRLTAATNKNTEQDTRLDALESKTQNQSATENETTFNGNVTVNTINGYSINETLTNVTNAAIPVIRADGVFEVRKFLDFHYLDYSSYCRLQYDKDKLQCNREFTATNIISNKGNLNNIVDRTVALENKNTEQDTRLDALESKDIAHEERLGSIEAMDTAQNETISNINTKNDEQDERLDALETTKLPTMQNGINNIDYKLANHLVPQVDSLNTITSTHTSQITDIETRLSEVEKYFDKVYPIGSVWVTVSNTTPPIGTWQIQNNGNAAYLLTNSSGTNIAGPLVYMYIRTA